MKVKRTQIPVEARMERLKAHLASGGRLGMLTSIDGSQLLTLVLDPASGSAECWESVLKGSRYPSLSSHIAQCHWAERTMWDMFGLYPEGHPRLKHNLLHEPYSPDLVPLRTKGEPDPIEGHRKYRLLEVKGDGPFEVPVGPIHAGIIEPGHFRFSCMGEIIMNLEIRLGYVHRGVEKRLAEVPWRNCRFIVEATASDSAVANALASAIAIESLAGVQASARAQALRTIALEIERVHMHIADLGGVAGDIGFLAISSTMARLRGNGFGIGDLLTGSRFLRSFICPGGVASDPTANMATIADAARQLRKEATTCMQMFLDSQVALDRMVTIGRVAPHLAADFGLVGVSGRASNVNYDTRVHFVQGVYPERPIEVAVQPGGDVYSRVRVRISELQTSLRVIEELAVSLPEGPLVVPVPEKLAANEMSVGIVEAHRGELIHLAVTDAEGKISRYAIKDPSVNNWTGLAIAVRNNLLADFPLCNKSFALSYSGHDL